MSPEHRSELDRITSRPLGLPAARSLAEAMKGQRVDTYHTEEPKPLDPDPEREPTRLEKWGALVAIAVIAVGTAWLVAFVQALETHR